MPKNGRASPATSVMRSAGRPPDFGRKVDGGDRLAYGTAPAAGEAVPQVQCESGRARSRRANGGAGRARSGCATASNMRCSGLAVVLLRALPVDVGAGPDGRRLAADRAVDGPPQAGARQPRPRLPRARRSGAAEDRGGAMEQSRAHFRRELHDRPDRRGSAQDRACHQPGIGEPARARRRLHRCRHSLGELGDRLLSVRRFPFGCRAISEYPQPTCKRIGASSCGGQVFDGGLFTKGAETPGRMMQWLRDGNAIGMLSDIRESRGVAVTAFGKPMLANPFPAMTARRLGTPPHCRPRDTAEGQPLPRGGRGDPGPGHRRPACRRQGRDAGAARPVRRLDSRAAGRMDVDPRPVAPEPPAAAAAARRAIVPCQPPLDRSISAA